MRSSIFNGICMLSLGLVVFLGGIAVADASTSADVLKKAGVKGGLVVHIGCGDGKFTAALRVSDSYIVQGLATDSDAVMAARESLAKSGDVTIALFDGRTLPYAWSLPTTTTTSLYSTTGIGVGIKGSGSPEVKRRCGISGCL